MVTSAMSFGRIVTETNMKIDSRTQDIVRSSVSRVNKMVTRDVPPDRTSRVVDQWDAMAPVQGNRPIGTISRTSSEAPTAPASPRW